MQIHFGWSGSFFPSFVWDIVSGSHPLLLGHRSLCIVLSWVRSRFTHVSERGFFPASSDAAILQLSFPVAARATTPIPPHLSCGGRGRSLRAAPTYRGKTLSAKPIKQKARVLPVPVSDGRPTCLLAYECCRVRSKSFSRFLRCSLLQISSPPRFLSSPPSFCLFWVLVGCSEHEQAIIRKSRFFFCSWGRKITILDEEYL